ncbi:MAG: nucleoside kinase [Omnitrophica WOR_2 bacterium]
MADLQFQLVSPRPTVEINLPDGRILSGPRGSSVGDFLKAIQGPDSAPIVGAVINGELRELTMPIQIEARVRPVTMAESDGMLIYRRSLTFLLDAAFEDLFPDAVLTVDHSVTSGGYYCQVSGRPPLNPEELSKLEQHMRELVEANLPFAKKEAPISEAIAYFKSKNQLETVRLLAHRRKDYLTLYSLGDHQDYHHGYMVPSTGYLCWFGLVITNGGFTLRYPRKLKPTEISPLPEYPKLLATFREYGDWLQRLGIDSVGALDDVIENGRIREIILVSEALHEQRVAAIATAIASRRKQVRIVLVAGPSSSGKTTFSKRLSIQLLAQGLSPLPLELDNYFLDRDKTPRNAAGELDFECLDALDRQKLVSDLSRLVAGEQVQMPRYNFKTGQSEKGDTIQIEPNQIIILEGIHGLNPNLIPGISRETTFRIYVSALTQLNLDRHNRISTTDTRLIRRIVRDARERGYSARDTISRWESVRIGEKDYIFPYQENANVMFNSALVYELGALKPMAEPLLRQVPHGTPEHIEAKRLLALLEWFLPLESDLIPDNSILREFIGGSIFQEFKLWQNHKNLTE